MATIFYSWQSDISNNINRSFIKDALEKAIKRITESLDLDEAPRLEQDTSDVPGSPEITNTILEKIEKCVVFVPDLTIVAHTDKKEPSPNPNVLIEYGYALKTLGSEHIISIMNESFGLAESSLPFDLRHRRWPIRYSLKEEASIEERKKQKEHLITQIEDAIKTIIRAGLLERKPENTIKLSASTYVFPNLSREAQILLKQASIDNHGTILNVRTFSGTTIQTNDKNIIENQTSREIAKWVGALKELISSKLIRDIGYKGEVFELTDLGYRVADTIAL